ncbi:hypothetical protein [Neomegalonema sp.]|uniref:DUF6950 family protein n=1 Tax=Neomegalonema sp. TaxID=2039713 RepID=UPI00262C2AB1|nr:hypothetical protein [Neomegalonema sp.]MDD2870242.1 hypothetical protein [Neomegalonema sp.]
MTLSDYLAQARSRRWLWGEVDCLHFALGWLAEATGRDLRPTLPAYGSYREGRRMLGALWPDYGAMLEDLAGRAGWLPRGGAPQAGDLALIAGGHGPTAAIRLAEGYAAQDAAGVIWLRAAPGARHWGPSCPR